MKIWYQSSAALGRDPLWTPYEESLKSHVRSVGGPDTTVDVYGTTVMIPERESYRSLEYVSKAEFINNAIRAEEEGYDAFCVGCMLDGGFPEIREVVDVPALFIAHTSFHLASLLAHKFSLLAYNEATSRRMREGIKEYGLGEHYTPATSFDLSLTEVAEGFANPEPVIKAVTGEVKRAGERGVSLLIPACGVLNMVLVKHRVRQLDGIIILDCVGALVKMAELIVNLGKMGIVQSKGLYPCLPKKYLKAVLPVIGPDQHKSEY